MCVCTTASADKAEWEYAKKKKVGKEPGFIVSSVVKLGYTGAHASATRSLAPPAAPSRCICQLSTLKVPCESGTKSA